MRIFASSVTQKIPFWVILFWLSMREQMYNCQNWLANSIKAGSAAAVGRYKVAPTGALPIDDDDKTLPGLHRHLPLTFSFGVNGHYIHVLCPLLFLKIFRDYIIEVFTFEFIQGEVNISFFLCIIKIF